VTGFFASGLAGTFATWVAALVTIGVWAYLLGERRLFRIAQHSLAGLATGYLVLVSIREVLLPRLVDPLRSDPLDSLLLWPALALAIVMIAARWLPRSLVAVPVAVLVAGTAVFALGGAVAGTILPQLGATLLRPGGGLSGLVNGLIGAVITMLVLFAFLQGTSRGRLAGSLGSTGRWLLIGGIGGWIGFLLVSRLSLLVDRVRFLLVDWLGLLS
jgi:hypothetical protein